ncbi:hypothetical protein ACI6PS_08245 [Flavobacterium sp. PLA-1-15]|uniref:hypothetical protein n=1 Tax=Flavobacterium sp. PLA-1-15 TaxID=3380533 RepID=UPI003B821F70
MIRFYWMLVFIGLSANAQQLELKIDSIIVDDSDNHERTFTVRYVLENLTEETILFFQDLDGIVPSIAGATGCKPYFKVFEEEILIERNVFNGWRKMTPNKREAPLNDTQKAFLKENPKSILAHLENINPKEKRYFEQIFFWDRRRYYEAHDIEYYLDEKTNYFFEITMVMAKERYKNDLPEELYKQIVSDNRFVVGAFTSNKYPIDFGKRK